AEEALGKDETSKPEFESPWKQKHIYLGSLSVGLWSNWFTPGSQKCRRPNYPLALVGRHSKLGSDNVVAQFWIS
ncbi:unnamed protein product, partial [Arabidopsis halleri]